jgi:hypothetical protein
MFYLFITLRAIHWQEIWSLHWCMAIQLRILTAWLNAFPMCTALMMTDYRNIRQWSYWHACTISLNQLLKLTVATKNTGPIILLNSGNTIISVTHIRWIQEWETWYHDDISQVMVWYLFTTHNHIVYLLVICCKYMQTAWYPQFQGLVLFLRAHGQRTTLQHQCTGNRHVTYAAPFHFVNVSIQNIRHDRQIMGLAFYGGTINCGKYVWQIPWQEQ